MINLRDDEIMQELRAAMATVQQNILDDHCDPEKKRTITLKITVDPNGDPNAEPIIDAEISCQLAPRHSTRISTAVSQINLFPFEEMAMITAEGEAIE